MSFEAYIYSLHSYFQYPCNKQRLFVQRQSQSLNNSTLKTLLVVCCYRKLSHSKKFPLIDCLYYSLNLLMKHLLLYTEVGPIQSNCMPELSYMYTLLYKKVLGHPSKRHFFVVAGMTLCYR